MTAAKPTLLLADGDPRTAQIVALALRQAGFAVETCAGQEEALGRMLEAAPDAVVCDGLALCRSIRAEPAIAGVPVVVTSADRALKPRAIEAGADDFLEKPILLRELVHRVRLLLDHRAREQPHGPAALTGSMRELGLVDLLQSLEGWRKSAVIACEAYGREARIWVRDGQIVDAELGALQGDAAFWRLMTWESGSFRVEFAPVDREARVEGGTQGALLEAMRRVDEIGRVSEELPMTSQLAVDFARLAELLADLPDEINCIVRNFDGRRTLREAIDLSPVDDLSTVAVVRRLLGDGVLRAVEGRRQAVGAKKPSLEQWLSNPPPAQEPHLPELDAARMAAELVEQMEAAEEAEILRSEEAGPAPSRLLPLVHFPPLRGVRRERLRREAEEARVRAGEKLPVRLTRVVELPPWRPAGSDALGEARRMSPAVGEAARKFAPDAPVARLVDGVAPAPEPEAVPASPSAAGPKTEPPEPVPTPPVAPVATPTPPPAAAVTPPDAAPEPGPPELEEAMLDALKPRSRRWGWYAAAGAGAMLVAWVLRPQPKDAPPADPPAAASPRTAAAAAGPPAAPPATSTPEPPSPAPAPTPVAVAAVAPPSAEDAAYAKALEHGDLLLKRGKYRQAAREFTRALKAKPGSVPALLALGDAYLEADQPRSALPPLEAAARLDGKSGRAQLLLGTAYQSLGRNAQAVKAYRRYLELEPAGEFVRDVRLILANLGHSG